MDAAQRTPFELDLPVPDPPDDPTDPQAIAVDARVIAPSGRVVVQPCFWTVPHERRLEVGRERWEPTGPGRFALRLCLPEAGRHAIEITCARGGGAPIVVHSFAVDVAAADVPGAVRTTRDAPRRLVRQDGAPFVPIGMNLCWWLGADPTVQMERALARMADAGMTWTRLWLTHFGEGLTIEWDAAHPAGHYAGLGRYSQIAAARLDRLFAAAGRLGIDVQLVLWQHSQLASPSHSAWADNPYNAARGGPCATSADFFASAEVARLSDRRLRYLVARYGAYPSLFAWEVFNEMDLVVDASLDVVAGWCADRVRTLRALDAHDHLVTTSQAFPPSLVPPIASVDDAYDLGQCHVYAEDLVEALAREAAALARASDKPFVAAEVGLGPGGELDRAHPDGRHLHDATWAALACGYAGGAMSWWWDSAIDARDWYHWQGGAARFVRACPLEGLGAPRSDVRVEGVAGARAVGRAGPDGALVWVTTGQALSCSGAVVSIPGLPDGAWTVEQWDTESGERVRRQEVVVSGNPVFQLGSFDHDTVVTIRHTALP